MSTATPVLNDEYAEAARYRHIPGATEFIRTYTDKSPYFALNRYAAFDTVTRADLTPDPGWDEKTGERNPHPDGVRVRDTARYCYPFNYPFESVRDSTVAEHAATAAAKAMDVRLLIGLELLKKTKPYAEAVRVADSGRSAVEEAVLSLGITHTRIVCNPITADELLDGKYKKLEAQQFTGAEMVGEHNRLVNHNGGLERQYIWPSDLIVVCRGPLLRYRFLKHNPADSFKHLPADVRPLVPAPEDRDVEMRMCVELKGPSHGRIVEDYRVELCDPALVRVILK